MKAEIHPKVHPVIFVDTNSGAKFYATSTLTSEETVEEKGTKYYVIKVETSSDTHPFYTGTQKTASKGNQVAKFLEKVKKAQALNKTKKPQQQTEPETSSEDKATKKTAKAKME